MTLNEARLIREIKKRSTYRRLAEIYYPENHDGHDNQGYGEDLCKEAFTVLYPNKNMHAVNDENAVFGLENKSAIGDFYWWE